MENQYISLSLDELKNVYFKDRKSWKMSYQEKKQLIDTFEEKYFNLNKADRELYKLDYLLICCANELEIVRESEFYYNCLKLAKTNDIDNISPFPQNIWKDKELIEGKKVLSKNEMLSIGKRLLEEKERETIKTELITKLGLNNLDFTKKDYEEVTTACEEFNIEDLRDFYNMKMNSNTYKTSKLTNEEVKDFKEKIFESNIDLEDKSNICKTIRITKDELKNGCRKQIKYRFINEEGNEVPTKINIKLPRYIKNKEKVVLIGKGNYVRNLKAYSNLILIVKY